MARVRRPKGNPEATCGPSGAVSGAQASPRPCDYLCLQPHLGNPESSSLHPHPPIPHSPTLNTHPPLIINSSYRSVYKDRMTQFRLGSQVLGVFRQLVGLLTM